MIRAFMWLRWRLLANSIRGGERRDMMERVSRALAAVLPLAIAALSFGSVLALGIVGFVAGRAMLSGVAEPPIVVLVVRGVLAAMLGLTIVVSLGSPAQSTLTRYTRLLLLPISRRALHGVEVAASLADPWILILIPGLVMFGVGLAVGGRLDVAAAALTGAALFVVLVACLGSLISFLVAWLMRSRRRGELVTLVFVLALSFLSIIPAMMSEELETRQRENRRGARPRAQFSVTRFDESLPRWTRALPSELYGAALIQTAGGRTGASVVALGGIAAEAVLLFAASSAAHGRLLRSLESNRTRRKSAGAASAGLRLPLIGPAASAVAFAQIRTALRSVRGRLVVLAPGPLVGMLVMLFSRIPGEEWAGVLAARPYYAVGAIAVFGLYAMQAFTMNMFGSDRAGLTLHFLSPVADVDLARGKIAGCAMMLAAILALGVVVVLVVIPSGSPFLWLAAVAGGFATFLWLSPLFVWFSALFPVAADLSKTGSGGNPHGLPMLLGTVLVLVVGAPAALVLIAAEFWLEQPAIGLALMAGWTLLSATVSWPLVSLASRTIGLRRENLAMVAQGK